MTGSAGPLADDAVARRLRSAVAALSGIVFLLVAALLLGPRPAWMLGAVDVSALPWVNAGLNAVALVLLVTGFGAVRAGRITLHRAAMTAAMATSAVFLVSYVTYHLFSPGPARYHGAFRGTYFALLASHVVLAALVLPAALNTWIRGFTGAIPSHRRLARPTLAVWIYVSITGILVTWMVH